MNVPIAELQTVRICCQSPNCGGVILEMSLDEMSRRYDKTTRCPLCQADFDPNRSGESALAKFARYAVRLQNLSSVVGVELVLSEKKGDTTTTP